MKKSTESIVTRELRLVRLLAGDWYVSASDCPRTTTTATTTQVAGKLLGGGRSDVRVSVRNSKREDRE